MKMSKEANYGNWVPADMMKMMWGTAAGLCVVTILLFKFLNTPVPGIIGVIATLLTVCMASYMQRCRKLFD